MAFRAYKHPNRKIDEDYYVWISENEPTNLELLQQKKDSKDFIYSPCISIITPVYKIAPEILKKAIYSVIDQTYDNWELCIVEANSENKKIKVLLKEISHKYPRIKVKFLKENLGISENTNIALSLVTGEFVCFLDHDDTLAPFALFEIVKVLNENKKIDLFYSDRDILSEDGKIRYNPLFKPDWSPDILLSANYLAHLCVIRKSVIDAVGGLCKDLDGAQDWDLYFRITEKTQSIYHIPKVLYHWRSISTSCAVNGVKAKPYIMDAQRISMERHFKRCGLSAVVQIKDPGVWHIQWNLPIDKKVSIIIPSNNILLLNNCINSIISLTEYMDYEIIIIDTGLDTSIDLEFFETIKTMETIKIIKYSDNFNYSRVNNIGSHHAQGEILLFLNDDTKVISPEWLKEMVGWVIIEEIGVVGAKLLRPDNTIQHAGVIIGLTGFAGHPFAGNYMHSMGYFGSTDWYRDYHAITGACMMVRREVFEEVGGFDETFILCGSDVELCLRIIKKGYRIIYNPFAILEHLESASRGSSIPKDDFQRSYEHYKLILEYGDKYFNKNLSYWNNSPKLHKKGEIEPLSFVKEMLQE
jgi:O-antigen biosynthesis protein